VADSCEHGNEILDSMKYWEFINWLSGFWLIFHLKCHFIYHNYHIDIFGIKPGTLRSEAGDYTAHPCQLSNKKLSKFKWSSSRYGHDTSSHIGGGTLLDLLMDCQLLITDSSACLAGSRAVLSWSLPRGQ
jgi:hypothetical protein